MCGGRQAPCHSKQQQIDGRAQTTERDAETALPPHDQPFGTASCLHTKTWIPPAQTKARDGNKKQRLDRKRLTMRVNLKASHSSERFSFHN